ncbi:ACP S-malonyltransferase [Paenibacillus sp. 481]|uniref:ACP S-malonyltransferase n=1 Tax=Paenibacillus sp. 481 TaxID=2835869 RepID=UPI001E5F3BDE|nr:ACP S-malonyltransferase [Paenibacillus sp. 481]UHA75638.1 ACP S-malonyltransferase [Paenibacillus sp. 481]
MKTAFLFPGQGSQFVGMGKGFCRKYGAAFEDTFTEASDALGFNLKQVCFEGPERELTKTEYAQPAIVTVSVGIYRLLMNEGIAPSVVAGHSVGQFSALVAAGVLPFAEAVRLVRKRGLCMAAVAQKGGMAAVVMSKPEQRAALIETIHEMEVDVASYNTPSQMVVSGAVDNIQRIVEYLNNQAGVRTKPLAVSHAFHSRLMAEMEAELMTYVKELHFNDASIPLVLNGNAKAVTCMNEIVNDIRDQCTQPVLWDQSMNTLHDLGVSQVIEVGASSTLIGMMRAIGYDWQTAAVDTPMTLEKLLRTERVYRNLEHEGRAAIV